MSRLLTPDEVAERWATTRARVLALARGGSLAYVDIAPRIRRFREADVEAFEAARRSYTPDDGATTAPGKRRRDSVPGPRPPKAVGRRADRGLDARGPADPTGALRVVRAGGESDAA